MRILLDTHVFIWAVTDDPRLTRATRRLMEDAEEVHVSAASIWEIAIKAALGKIDAESEEMARAIKESGFVELPVSTAHAAQVAKLPLLHDHKDGALKIQVQHYRERMLHGKKLQAVEH